MKLVSHLSVGAAALAVGGVAAGTITAARDRPAPPVAGAQPEQVRTVVVTQTVHRTRHVKPKARHAAAAPAPAPAAPVVRASAPAPRSAAPVRSQTSGGRAGGDDGAEHERGEDGGRDD